MKLSPDPSKYSAKFKYVETAHYVADLNKVVRDKTREKDPKDRKSILISVEDIDKYAKKHNNEGIYTSIFQYNGTDIDSSERICSLYFDLDSDEIETSYEETLRLVEHLSGHIPAAALRIYFSGKKGFHVECECLALGIGPAEDLAGIFRFIATDLKNKLSINTFDFNVYDVRRMWRCANSRHQQTGLYKTEVTRLLGRDIQEIIEYSKERHDIEIPEQSFDHKANEWYRTYVYGYEDTHVSQSNTGDLLQRFLKSGSNSFKIADNMEKEFDPIQLFEGCPAILKLWEKAEKIHDLTHLERLFLCSILSYTEESIEYLHMILGQCHDYKKEITDAHIQDWIHRRENGTGGRPVTCQKAADWGIVCSGCSELKPHRKIVQLDNNKYYETDEEILPSPVRLAYTYKRELEDI